MTCRRAARQQPGPPGASPTPSTSTREATTCQRGRAASLQIASSAVTGGDNQAYIQLESQDYAGQTTFVVGATVMQLNGFDISSQATPSIASVSHNPFDPGYGGAGGSSWNTGERAALDSQVDTINSNFVNIVAALQAAGIWH